VCAVENVQLVWCIPYGAALLVEALDAGARLLGTALLPNAPRFASTPLSRRVHIVELGELSPHETLEVLRAVAEPLALHHRLRIDESCLAACVQASRPLPGCFPAKAVTVLDAAAARAALAGSAGIGPDDIYAAIGRVEAHRVDEG